mmetsp:Transcript_12175/g.37492  ORF Transcript_12175/g.37492 Transcript_12175/m.37492 type:complete len:253 (-) Transcript_12175:155-913(-)
MPRAPRARACTVPNTCGASPCAVVRRLWRGSYERIRRPPTLPTPREARRRAAAAGPARLTTSSTTCTRARPGSRASATCRRRCRAACRPRRALSRASCTRVRSLTAWAACCRRRRRLVRRISAPCPCPRRPRTRPPAPGAPRLVRRAPPPPSPPSRGLWRCDFRARLTKTTSGIAPRRRRRPSGRRRRASRRIPKKRRSSGPGRPRGAARGGRGGGRARLCGRARARSISETPRAPSTSRRAPPAGWCRACA